MSGGTCSRARWPRPHSVEFVAGVGEPGPRPRATILAPRSCWARRAASAIIVLFVVSCANFASPPAITPALIANARRDHVSAKKLATGRNLFVSRCLECHTLPSVTKRSPGEWPHLVSRMAARANLSASDQQAITVYLRAASSTRLYLGN